jgi:hypothetical protein
MQVDVVFSKVKANPKVLKISYTQFVECIRVCVEDVRGDDFNVVVAAALKAGGPTFKGTHALATRFHDDKDLYTGVHGNGGPSNVDRERVYDISTLCDRSCADARGVKM